MDLSIVVDRGDVWYDPPFDDKGHYKPQTRKKYPLLTLLREGGRQAGGAGALAHHHRRLALRPGRNGYEYFRYKGSDVGPRVIRHIVSGPVWIAPASTPIRSWSRASWSTASGCRSSTTTSSAPGYLSAYGLIAGYFVVPGQNGRNDFDNGVRAHGSSDYLSIYSANGYSHGCHRLPNHLAIRLYSFILRHRHMKVSGDQPMGFTRQFLWKNTVYEMRMPSRGYLYELDPPRAGQRARGEHHGRREEADPRLRPQALEQVPARPAAAGARPAATRPEEAAVAASSHHAGAGAAILAAAGCCFALAPFALYAASDGGARAAGRRRRSRAAAGRTVAERADRLHHRPQQRRRWSSGGRSGSASSRRTRR